MNKSGICSNCRGAREEEERKDRALKKGLDELRQRRKGIIL